MYTYYSINSTGPTYVRSQIIQSILILYFFYLLSLPIWIHAELSGFSPSIPKVRSLCLNLSRSMAKQAGSSSSVHSNTQSLKIWWMHRSNVVPKKREGVRRRRKSEIIDLQPNRTTKRNAERGWNTPSQEVNMAVVHAGHKSEEWLTWIHWIHWNPLRGWGRYCWKMRFWREERKRGIVRSSAFFQTVERLCMT